MRRLCFLLVLALAACNGSVTHSNVAAPAVAAPAPPPPETGRDPAAFPAGAYRMDKGHTSVIWRVRHMGLSMFTGRFDAKQGTLTFDPAHPEASHLEVTIDATSVNTGILDRQGQRSFDNDIANNLGATA